MKAITPVIAIIVLLLITVAISGAAWTYISGYWSGMVDKQIEVTDAFCVGTNQAKIIVRNIGNNPLTTGDITVMNKTSGTDLTDKVLWTSQVSPPDYGLVMHLEFEEGSGTIAYDTTGHQHNGTFQSSGVTWTEGKFGGGISFDGASYVEVPDSPELKVTSSAFTASVWAYIDGSDPDGAYVFAKPWNGGGVYNYGLIRAAGSCQTYAWINYSISMSGPAMACNKWHHYAYTVDATNFAYYIDGVPVSSIAHGITSWMPGVPQNWALALGTLFPYGPGAVPTQYSMIGKMDDFRLYNRALSADEIRALAGVAQVVPGGTATLTSVCKGRCSYNVIIGGRARQATVDCS